jgi:hypothetical protein
MEAARSVSLCPPYYCIALRLCDNFDFDDLKKTDAEKFKIYKKQLFLHVMKQHGPAFSFF